MAMAATYTLEHGCRSGKSLQAAAALLGTSAALESAQWTRLRPHQHLSLRNMARLPRFAHVRTDDADAADAADADAADADADDADADPPPVARGDDTPCAPQLSMMVFSSLQALNRLGTLQSLFDKNFDPTGTKPQKGHFCGSEKSWDDQKQGQ